jgi:glycosyltransferase involved in cell wall biosynthesis
MIVHVVVPEGIDDPTRPSGGNAYDRRLLDGLGGSGWSVREHAVPGPWPRPDEPARAALAAVVAAIPDDALVLLDGLVASATPDVLVPHARRLRLVVLVHMPLGHRPTGDPQEQAVLGAATAIVATSPWTRRLLLELYALPADRVHVAEPGVDVADLSTGTPAAGALLCVAAVTEAKGHDLLVTALESVADLSWTCQCAGSLDREPAFVADLHRRVEAAGLDDRVTFPGPLNAAALDRRYATADALVLASRAETYGMVVTEALARGLPVVATAVGGLPDALGHGDDGTRPGLLVPPDDPLALAAALRSWLGDGTLRTRLRRAAHERRATLGGWSATTATVAGVLAVARR